MHYTVVVHADETGGYWVEVPALPGCASQGETVDEALENVRDAITLYLQVLQEDGAPIPQDDEVVFRVTVAA
ncbi:MAG: type II toxin-antitoxin system HicB family antitoxin [Dehalococcoidia bacterium]|nr:type II toxin-antitoxin system HicB family antitoxin [Dehalococcoidia bacterium]